MFGGVILFFLVMFAKLAIGEELKYSDEWVKCGKSNECVVMEGACDWTSVNKFYAEEAQKYYQHMQSLVECDAVGFQEPKPEPFCFETQCDLNLVGKNKDDSTKKK